MEWNIWWGKGHKYFQGIIKDKYEIKRYPRTEVWRVPKFKEFKELTKEENMQSGLKIAENLGEWTA